MYFVDLKSQINAKREVGMTRLQFIKVLKKMKITYPDMYSVAKGTRHGIIDDKYVEAFKLECSKVPQVRSD